MNDNEVHTLITRLAENPDAGDVIEGTGGCRKLRFGGRGKGKSGGYRIITFYTGKSMPVFLITIFSKGERSDLAKAEKNELTQLTREIAAEYAVRIVKVGG